VRRVLAGLGLAAVLLLGPSGSSALAQDPVQVPTQDIVPEPNSGQAPSEAGDRGGALQLLILGAVLATIGGATCHLVRQSRRAREGST